MPPILIAVLLVLAYALVTAVLTVLSHQARNQIGRHDLIRQTRTRRLQYELTLIKRQRELQADLGHDVEILGDGSDAVVGEIGPGQAPPQRQAA